MKTTISILQKVLVNHFYRLNAGLFMFLFYVLFGLPQDAGGFHIAIATLIVNNRLFLLLVFSMWLLYNFKCIDYICKNLKEPEQLFLTCIENTGSFKCYMYMVYVQYLVYLPVTAYSVFLIIIALKEHAYIPVIEIIAYETVMLFSAPLLYKSVLQRRWNGFQFSLPALLRIPKPLFLVPLFHILNNRKQMLLITKLFSLGILWLFIKEFDPDHYDIRPVLFCFLLATIANCTIVFEIRNFEEEHLYISRNFPLSLTRRFINVLLMYTVLLLPEMLFVCKGYPLYFNLFDYLQLTFSAVALLCLLHVCLLIQNITIETYIKIVFGIAMGLFFIILYNPGIILSLFLLLAAFAIFHSHYHDVER